MVSLIGLVHSGSCSVRSRRVRALLVAIVGSSVLHSMAIVIALLGSVWSATTLERSASPTMDARVPKWASQSTESRVNADADANAVRVAPLEDDSGLSPHSSDELQRPVANERLKQLARKQLAIETKQAESLDSEQQLQKLQTASKRLSQLSSDKSVSEMSDQFRKVFDLSERATQPVAAGEEKDRFDPESAQLHDVLKETNDEGQDRYVAVLLDAQGLTSKFPLSEDEGKKLHRMMQLIKSNPLLEKVYRELAMPLLDQLLKKSSDESQGTSKPRK